MKIFKTLIFCMIVTTLTAKAQTQLTASESDPIRIGWMQGFPPPPDRTVSMADGSFFEFPALRYSVCNMRLFMPTREVRSAQVNRYTFKVCLDPDIDNITFIPLFEKEPITWKQALEKVYTDGIIILHQGTIVYEKYFGALAPDGTHAAMSCSKTLTGTLGATLVAEGVINPEKRADFYVPELKESGFGNATIRELLDMTTSIQYIEDYSDPNAEVWKFSEAGNVFHPADYSGYKNFYDYIVTVRQSGPHGRKFAYKTINTDVLAWVISRATGKNIAQLLSEKIWQPMGAHIDGYYQVDASGIPFAGGGFNGSLRDYAMFGEMVRCGGFFNGKQIIPESVLDDIIYHVETSKFDVKAYPNLKGWGYRNMWWVTNNDNQAFMARGVHGQAIYIDPTAEIVIVRLASHPEASNAVNDPYSLPAYQAIADYFLNMQLPE